MSEAIDISERARRLGVSFGARLTGQPARVLQQLGITFSREEWAAFNEKAGTNSPYPFADIVPFPPQPKEGKTE